MDVVFRFEAGRAQIILNPTTAIDEANLKTIGMYGDKIVRFRVGSGKELIVEAETIKGTNGNGKTKEAGTTQPAEDSLPS